MKKVLIICDLFPPAFGPRMGYLCKYIRTFGWEPTVVTEAVDENTFTFLAGNCPVTYVNYYPACGKRMRKLQWLATFLINIFWDYKNHRLYKAADAIARKEAFDVVLCSTYRTFPLPAAWRIARKYRLPLVTDLRDMIEQYTGNEFITHRLPRFLGFDRWGAAAFKWKSLRQRNRVVRQADQVTTVSPWHTEVLRAYNPNTSLIYNGFDPDLFFPQHEPTDRFVITYTGRLLSTAMRDPGLLLEALSRLRQKGVFTPENCRVYWYVDPLSQQTITAEADQAGVSEFMDFKGYVPASDIPSVLCRSSVLLLLTNRSDEKGPKGVMTTKFFESLAVEKPILCVRSDEGCLEEALRESKAGLAARSVEEVCGFLEDCFAEWKEKGYTRAATDPTVLRTYSRKEQAGQFVRIFNQLMVP